jgi:hypothetical protein
MGTLTITGAGFNPGPNGSKSYTLTDADWQTLITYMATKFAPHPDDGTVTPLTPTQALLAWVNDWVIHTRDEIRSTQQRTAEQAAVAAVNTPPIVFT